MKRDDEKEIVKNESNAESSNAERPYAQRVVKKGSRRRGRIKQTLKDKDEKMFSIFKERNEILKKSHQDLIQSSIESRVKAVRDAGIELPENIIKSILEFLDRISVELVIRPALTEIDKRFPKQ